MPHSEILQSLMQYIKEDGYNESIDSYGNVYHWFKFLLPESILPASRMLLQYQVRLLMTTAYNIKHLQDPIHEVCYHFEKQGTIFNITVLLDAENNRVPSISGVYDNADWHEREMMELYNINIMDHPNPRRLFLDPEIDKGILGETVPLSIMMNGASTVDLWECILKDRAQATEKAATDAATKEL